MRTIADTEIGKFLKVDSQKNIVGAIGNQIRVLVQRMKMRGYQPWKILLSRGLRDALRLDSGESPDYVRHDVADCFMGLEIKLDASVEEPIIMVKPVLRDAPLADAAGQSTDPRRNWKRRFHAIS